MKKKSLMFIALLITVVGVCVAYDYLTRDARSQFATSSCANHFGMHRMRFNSLLYRDKDLILPEANSTTEALIKIYSTGLKAEDVSEVKEWVRFYDASGCPEANQDFGDIGYVYIGEGLKLSDVMEKKVLILFCPHSSHRGSSEHAHAYSGTGSDYCVSTNEHMIEKLKDAIVRGESGEVAYSPRAMKVLKFELSQRQ